MPNESNYQSDLIPPAPSALESAESYVASCASTGSPSDEGSRAFTASFAALVEWGEVNKKICKKADFAVLNRAPDAQGQEHKVWFDSNTNRWFKVTHVNTFGLAWGRRGSATPLEYLRWLILQNAIFGDNIELEALLNDDSKLRILISHSHIDGEAATYEGIQQWFTSLGFRQIHQSNQIAWYLDEENLLVADAHEGNVIRTLDDELVPIDLNLIHPLGDMLVWVRDNLKKHL